MSSSYRITARVPVFVKADDQSIVCNSTKGYRLYLREAATGYKILMEEHRGAVQKRNPFTKPDPADTWVIEAI
jgi:hypothetical protein